MMTVGLFQFRSFETNQPFYIGQKIKECHQFRGGLSLSNMEGVWRGGPWRYLDFAYLESLTMSTSEVSVLCSPTTTKKGRDIEKKKKKGIIVIDRISKLGAILRRLIY